MRAADASSATRAALTDDREQSMTDDHQRHLLTRRRTLSLLGSSGAALLAAGTAGRLPIALARSEGHDHVANAASACVLTAEQEEGPFYVAVDDVRQDIVLRQTGLPLDLTITIISTHTCKPLKHAAVDIWHCNADGVYSDISSEQTLGQTYLRGVQFTDNHGQVTFKTIFPGHYSGRTTHIHARIHISSGDYRGKLVGGHVAHTGQLFPSDAVNAEVYKLASYSTETAAVVAHPADRVWTQQHGAQGLLKIAKLGNRLSKGLTASVTLAVNPSATPALIGAASPSRSG
ncbi:MAG TPA: intradiol ring-cleavage dioxygenase [Solirubrobacteraceae bacterium]|jgi:protocatechuate 3,4-dioxygenase beta subunit|nr:intradiol ring-cleavage dioxygenase [Solirubrobacteraceae bacterium]